MPRSSVRHPESRPRRKPGTWLHDRVELSWIAKKTKLSFEESSELTQALLADPYGIKNKHDVAVLARLPETHPRWAHYSPLQRSVLLRITKRQSKCLLAPPKKQVQTEETQRARHAELVANGGVRVGVQSCSRCGLLGHRYMKCLVQSIPSVTIEEVVYST